MRLDSWTPSGTNAMYAFGMGSTQVSVFKTHQIGFTCFLQSTNGYILEARTCFEVLSNFSTKPWQESFGSEAQWPSDHFSCPEEL